MSGASENEDAVNFAVHVLSREEVQELKEIFDLVDLDGGGTIQTDELETLMKKLGLDSSSAEITNLVNEIDIYGKGEIDFDTFVLAMSRKVTPSFSDVEMKRAFKKFEKKSYPAGHIKVKDLFFALTEMADPSQRMSIEGATALIRKVMS